MTDPGIGFRIPISGFRPDLHRDLLGAGRLGPAVESRRRLRYGWGLLLTHLERAANERVPEARLEHLIATWRMVASREIAALVDATSKLCRIGQATVDGDTASRKAAWTAVAERKSAADLDRLVEALVVRDEATCVKRLRLLGGVPRNPRLTTALVEVFAKSPFATDAHRVWKALEEALLATGDPRLRDAPMIARLPPALGTRWNRDLIAEPRALDDIERAALTRVTDSIQSTELRAAQTREVGAALLRTVHDHPTDDAPREVYGDWLTARGDSRGEFIALQLARRRQEPSRRALARERALLVEFSGAWLGRGARLITHDGARFERGFLAAALLEREMAVGLTDDIWHTCRELDFSNVVATDEQVVTLLDSPTLHAVEAILGAWIGVFEGLVRLAAGESPRPRLDALRGRLRVLGTRGPLDTLDRVEPLSKDFPRIEELVWFGSGDPARLLKHVLDGGLHERLRRVCHRQPASAKGKDVHEITLERHEGELSFLSISFGGRDPIGIHVAVTSAVEVVNAIGPRVKKLVVALMDGVDRAVLAPLERAASSFALAWT